jgi:hypothetical protein
MASTCIDYSDHASMSITELEVFTGNIFNKSGIQTRRQRDRSLQLKDKFERIALKTTTLSATAQMVNTDRSHCSCASLASTLDASVRRAAGAEQGIDRQREMITLASRLLQPVA